MKKIVDNFFALYDEYKITPITSGNINKTFLLNIRQHGEIKKYVLQMINKSVFNNPKQVILNGVKILQASKNEVLYYVKTLLEENYYEDNDGNYWRTFNFVENSISFNQTDNLFLIEETGRAFGNFFSLLDNFEANSLYLTIPDFHNTKKRFLKLEMARKNSSERFKRIEREWQLISTLKNKVFALQSMLEAGELPLRVTHNDTKCSNVLFDKESLKFLTVIDFDTVMPGIIAHDFGDGARSICSTKKEDDCDFDKIKFDLEKFYYFSRGFIQEIKHVLTEKEKQTLYQGVLTITVELAMRFLTDYLQNDIYFSIDYPDHNRIRAINQLVLACDIFDKEGQIKKITYEFLK